jgi:hypothetical protein
VYAIETPLVISVIPLTAQESETDYRDENMLAAAVVGRNQSSLRLFLSGLKRRRIRVRPGPGMPADRAALMTSVPGTP